MAEQPIDKKEFVNFYDRIADLLGEDSLRVVEEPEELVENPAWKAAMEFTCIPSSLKPIHVICRRDGEEQEEAGVEDIGS